MMDLTTLKTDDTPASVEKLVGKVNSFNETYPDWPLPASVCVYSNFASVVDAARKKDFNITVVSACFPSSQSFLEVKLKECEMAVEQGADEVDIVLALNKFLAGDFEAAAEEILNQWKAGTADEAYFAQLATEKTEDPGSKETGGLYENVKTGQMVPEFDAWCFDESRKTGDTGLVKTTYGYHVMFYSDDEALWVSKSREAIRSEKISEFVDAAVEANPLEADYSKMMLGFKALAG